MAQPRADSDLNRVSRNIYSTLDNVVAINDALFTKSPTFQVPIKMTRFVKIGVSEDTHTALDLYRWASHSYRDL